MNELMLPPWTEFDSGARPVSNSARRLADEIFRQICCGDYKPGMKLPTERHLALSNGVSRTTVRRALALLQAHDVIDRRQGSGSFVCAGQPPGDAEVDRLGEALSGVSDLSQITSPLELGVVRSIIEPEIVRLAVLNITSRDIRKLREIVDEMDSIKTDGEAFSAVDDRLRLHLAECTRNPLLLAISRITWHVATHADWGRSHRESLSPGQISSYAARNRALCQAIEKRDVDAAVEHLKLTLADSHRDFVRV